MEEPSHLELVFVPQPEGGYRVYAPDLPGLHSQSDTLAEAMTNAREASRRPSTYSSSASSRPLDAGVVRRRVPVPA